MSEEIRKKVDEDWKKQVGKEKEDSLQTNKEFHQPTFGVLVSSLSMQAMISLGNIDNPLTNKKEENLEQARFLIDTLSILDEKTEGNLDQSETNFLRDSLYHLRLNYIEKQNLKNKGL